MRLCDSCGKETERPEQVDKAVLCETCAPEIRAELERRRKDGITPNALYIAHKRLRARGTKEHMIRDVPAEWWKQVQHRAIDEGTKVRELVIKAIDEYLKRGK